MSVITAVADGFEQHLRVEIVSDTPDKIERYRKAICELILAELSAGDHDVIVVIHDQPFETEGKQ